MANGLVVAIQKRVHEGWGKDLKYQNYYALSLSLPLDCTLFDPHLAPYRSNQPLNPLAQAVVRLWFRRAKVRQGIIKVPRTGPPAVRFLCSGFMLKQVVLHVNSHF